MNRCRFLFLLICVLAFSIFGRFSLGNAPTLVTRCALDIGSASTKIKIAIIDPDLQTVKRVLFKSDTKVLYKESMTGDGMIPEVTTREGIQDMQELIKLGRLAIPSSQHDFVCRGVATAAFRKAKNGAEVVKQLEAGVGIKIKIISQDEEGFLGFYSGFSGLALDKSQVVSPWDVVVWDIGAGSQQLTLLNSDRKASENQFIVQKSELAAESFARLVMTEIQKRPKAKSPNPLMPEDVTKALALARDAASGTGKTVLERVKAKGSVVIGISGVLAKSVRSQADVQDGDYLLIEKLRETLEKRAGLTDQQVGGKYAPTDVTNLILTLGYMEALGIERLLLLDVNLTDGLLIKPEYWIY